MASRGPLLTTFASDLRDVARDGDAIAARLYQALQAERKEAGILDIWQYDFRVEMELINGEHWAIECRGPYAFRLYPGIVREDSVTWLNVWVVADYTLEELVERLNEVLASAKGGQK